MRLRRAARFQLKPWPVACAGRDELHAGHVERVSHCFNVARCRLTQKLSPAYQRHAIVSRSEALLAVINVSEACETVRALLAAVETAIGCDGERA